MTLGTQGPGLADDHHISASSRDSWFWKTVAIPVMPFFLRDAAVYKPLNGARWSDDLKRFKDLVADQIFWDLGERD